MDFDAFGYDDTLNTERNNEDENNEDVIFRIEDDDELEYINSLNPSINDPNRISTNRRTTIKSIHESQRTYK